MKRLILIILILSILLCCACGKSGAAKGSLSIWYIKGDILEAELNNIADSYMKKNPGVSIELRSFGGEGELSAALEGKRPDLLLCAHPLAFTLYEQGRLRSINLKPVCAEQKYINAYPALSGSFFPVGATADVLVYDKNAYSAEKLSSLESFLESTAENHVQGLAPFTADSFASLFASALMQLDTELSIDRYINCSSESYVYLHNLLAEAAYSGGLAAFDEGAAVLLREERVSAAVMPSYAAAEFADSHGLCPVPAAEGGDKRCLAQMHGFAYVGNTFDNSALTGNFLEFVFSGELDETATERGLITVSPASAAESSLFSGWTLVLPSPVSSYSMARQELEEQLRFTFRCLQ